MASLPRAAQNPPHRNGTPGPAVISAESKAKLYVSCAGLLWASAGMIGASTDFSPLLLAEVRLGTAAVVLLALLGPQRVGRVFAGLRGNLILGAVAGMGLFQWSFFLAVAHAGASFATWASVATSPLWAAVLSAPGTRRRTTVTGILACVAVGSGLALLAIGGGISLTGFIVCMPVGLAYALYAVSATRAARDAAVSTGADASLTITAIALAGGALVLLPLAWHPLVAELGGHSWRSRDIVRLAFLGLGSTALAYLLFARGLHRLTAKSALSLQWVQPVATEIFSASAPGYALAPIRIAGMALLSITMLGGSLRPHPAPTIQTINERA